MFYSISLGYRSNAFSSDKYTPLNSYKVLMLVGLFAWNIACNWLCIQEYSTVDRSIWKFTRSHSSAMLNYTLTSINLFAFNVLYSGYILVHVLVTRFEIITVSKPTSCLKNIILNRLHHFSKVKSWIKLMKVLYLCLY